MKLANFSIVQPYATEIHAFGFLWDLHNIAAFEGFSRNLEADTVQLNWRIDLTFARRKYPARQFSILFRDVEFLEVTPRDPELPKSEDNCLRAKSAEFVLHGVAA